MFGLDQKHVVFIVIYTLNIYTHTYACLHTIYTYTHIHIYAHSEEEKKNKKKGKTEMILHFIASVSIETSTSQHCVDPDEDIQVSDGGGHLPVIHKTCILSYL